MTEWTGDERRNFNVRTSLMKAIDGENDGKMRNNYMLMLGIIEAMEAGFSRIERKIDTVLKDEKAIKAMALNGHVERHHEHHDFIEQRMQNHGLCSWAAQQKATQEEAERNKKSVVQKFFEGAAGHLGSLIAGGVLVWLLLQIKG